MTLDDIHLEWDKDQDLDLSQLDKAIRHVPLLHGKWWKIYTTERLRYADVKTTRQQVYHDKIE